MNNRIIDVQEKLIREIERIDGCDMLDTEGTKNELNRATALYNVSTCFIKSVNTNISIMNLAKRNEIKYEKLMKKLGL